MDLFSSELFSGFEQHSQTDVNGGGDEDKLRASYGRKRRLEELVDSNTASVHIQSDGAAMNGVDEDAEKALVVNEVNADEEEFVFSPSSFEALTNPAKVYPFRLDAFQQEAIMCIENNRSVLVAAHTSAGKTAVAEYAIAKSIRGKQRVIYTSPIKALSNQKFRDMQEEFTDVGLMTGDMTINPSATVLIMTTEILRSMLYRGSEVVREVAWVIYDEVHYMRDKERGVVWEESIILLPHKVRFVFLSATIPNAKEFVAWISKLHHQPCHVVYTDYRPVPLQHFLFPSGADGLYLVVDEKGAFREENFQKAMSVFQSEEGAEESRREGSKKITTKGQNSDLFRIVKLIMERELDPCIVFSFSKKDCESYALQMSRFDFTSDEEKELIEQVFLNALEALTEEDRKLPQVETILPLLKRGVGIHHGGLLPILKEIIEILFQESLIKCLFATETFSIGINMPARTVVFTKTRKFDGQDFRWITSGEYIQMSGRAGRRGKDDKGIVIQMIDQQVEPEVAKAMLYGSSDPLYSSYQVTYNMVLNMLRVEDANPENLLKLSFHQFQHEAKAPLMEAQADEIAREASDVTFDNEGIIETFSSLKRQYENTYEEISRTVREPEHCLPFLQPGRLVFMKSSKEVWGWGTLVNIHKNMKGSSDSIVGGIVSTSSGVSYTLDVLLLVKRTDGSNFQSYDATVEGSSRDVEPQILQVSLSLLYKISAIRLNLPKQLSTVAERLNVQRSLLELLKRFKNGNDIPLLDPVNDMAIKQPSFLTTFSRLHDLRERLSACDFNKHPDKDALYEKYNRKTQLLEQSRNLRKQSRESQAVLMKEELRRMKRVLRRLGFVSGEDVLEIKGKFSCELNTADELLLTEMVFEGVFNTLTKVQVVALLSCFVHQEISKDASTTPLSELREAFKHLQNIARTIAKAKSDAKIPCDEEEYVKTFNPSLMEAAAAWSSGRKFLDVMKLTEVFEGSLIRSLRRLEELLRQLASAALSIGNTELHAKFEDGADSIRRGVVFAASLYL